MAKKEVTKTKKSTKLIGTGSSRSKTGGEFTIKRETITDDEKKKYKFLIIGAAGHVNPFNTANEVVNFCLAVYKRKIDISALRSGVLEFLDDGGISRSEKAKLLVASGRLDRAIESIESARAVFLKGDLSEGSTNMKMIDALSTLQNPIISVKTLIADTINPPEPIPEDDGEDDGDENPFI
jgi:hypothetical protein